MKKIITLLAVALISCDRTEIDKEPHTDFPDSVRVLTLEGDTVTFYKFSNQKVMKVNTNKNK